MGALTEGDLPTHHHWTRWWLRRFKFGILHRGEPNRVVLYDRMLREDVGEALRYPQEFQDLLSQLRNLRARYKEPIDQYVFCDEYGNIA